MPSYTAEGPGGYGVAIAVKRSLARAGFEAGVTVGGLWVVLEPQQIPYVKSIVAEFNWYLRGGASSAMLIAMEEMSIADGEWQSTRDMHDKGRDSQSIVQEWDKLS